MDTKFVVDILISLSVEELHNFRKLADQRKTTVPLIVRECMTLKCQELLQESSVADLARATTGTPEEDVVKPVS